jgi:hypothetical protein
MDIPRSGAERCAACRLDAARSRLLIGLGGLVQKAGLVELVDDDRATLLGAFLALVDQLQEDGHQEEKSAPAIRTR